VIVLATRYGEIFWIFPPLVTVGSLAAAALTYWAGRSAGYAGLPRLVQPHHLERIKARLDKAGAGALAAAAVLPPPFPLTAFVLMCGALDLNRTRFFLVFGIMRLIRFGTVAVLARLYGNRVLNMIDSAGLQTAVVALAIVICMTTSASAIMLWRRTRPQPA